MTVSRKIDQCFEWVLIYEGGVLASRKVAPLPLPTVSEMIWRQIRKPFGWVIPLFMCGWLARHFFIHTP